MIIFLAPWNFGFVLDIPWTSDATVLSALFSEAQFKFALNSNVHAVSFRGLSTANIECKSFSIYSGHICQTNDTTPFWLPNWKFRGKIFNTDSHKFFIGKFVRASTRPYCFTLVDFIDECLACFVILFVRFKLFLYMKIFNFITALFAHIVRRVFVICIPFSICSPSLRKLAPRTSFCNSPETNNDNKPSCIHLVYYLYNFTATLPKNNEKENSSVVRLHNYFRIFFFFFIQKNQIK